MVYSHRCSAEEGTSAPLLPETAEEVWNEPQHRQIILLMHCGEHPDLPHHRLVWKQHRWQTQNSGDLLFLQYKNKQVAHSAPRMLINSHGCLGFHSLCSFWLSLQPSPRVRVSTPSLSLSSTRSPVVFIRSLHANYCNQAQVFLILHLTHILTAVC